MTRTIDSALSTLRQADQHVTTAALDLAKAVDTFAAYTPLLEHPSVSAHLSIYRGATAARAAAVADLMDLRCRTCGDADHTTAEHSTPLDAIPNDVEYDGLRTWDGP